MTIKCENRILTQSYENMEKKDNQILKVDEREREKIVEWKFCKKKMKKKKSTNTKTGQNHRNELNYKLNYYYVLNSYYFFES